MTNDVEKGLGEDWAAWVTWRFAIISTDDRGNIRNLILEYRHMMTKSRVEKQYAYTGQ